MAQRTISGTVTGADDGLPLIGATLQIEGTGKGTVTDIDGHYTLQVGESKTITVSFIGYERQRIAITAATQYDVVLKPSASMLNEVVVTGMAVKREQKSLGYAVQHVASDELTQAAADNVATALQGKMAGVQISQAGGAVGASQRIVIRGNSSFTNNTPMIVVDGIPMNNDEIGINTGISPRRGLVDAGTGLADLNPEDIESISVLKGASAAIYGMRAGNGVLLITTKKGDKRKGLTVSYDGSLTFDHIYCLPNLQNLYGQGYYGYEYMYNKLKSEGYFADPNLSYAEFATGNWQGCRYDENGVLMDGQYFGYGYSYLDGMGGGVNDAVDESWGPRLDIGLKIKQYNSPVINGVRQATDWVSHPDNMKDLFDIGFSQNHLFAVSNSGEHGYYRAAIGYRGQKGTMPNTSMQRYNASLTGNYQINDIFSFDGKMYLTHSNSDNLMSTGYSCQNPIQSMFQWSARQIDVSDLRRNYKAIDIYGNSYNWISAYHTNPFYILYNNTTSLRRDRMMTSGSLHAKATEWLRFEARIGYDSYFNSLNTHILKDYDYINGKLSTLDQTNREFNADFIGYIEKRWDKISLNGLFGANYIDYKYSLTSIESNDATGLTIPGLFTFSNIAGAPIVETDHSHIRSNSLYANIVGGWHDQVFLEASLRGDWHSTLTTSFFYPSLCGSWVLTESFPALRGKVLDYLKLRLNWANIGGATTAYTSGSYYSASSSTIAGISQFYLPNTYANPNLRPENINTSEIGFESSFLDNRLRLDLCGYYRTTTDQIMAIQVSASTGYQYKMINAGNVRNAGFEAMLAADIVRQPNHGWRWTTSLNFSLDRSKVIELANGMETYLLATNNASLYAKVGDSWGTLMGSDFRYNDKGEALVGADGFPLIDENKTIGNIQPDWLMGWSNEISYRSLSFGFLLDFRHGGDFYSGTQGCSVYSGVNKMTIENNIREDGAIFGTNFATDYTFVHEDGTPNTTAVDPREAAIIFSSTNKSNVIDGSFLKLREMHITYQLPQKWISRLHLQDAKVSLVANNVAILWLHSSNKTNIDPESSFGSSLGMQGFETGYCPPSRSIGLKLNLLF